MSSDAQQIAKMNEATTIAKRISCTVRAYRF